jgi:hypothetical protein
MEGLGWGQVCVEKESWKGGRGNFERGDKVEVSASEGRWR